jgi:hypothetical protein
VAAAAVLGVQPVRQALLDLVRGRSRDKARNPGSRFRLVPDPDDDDLDEDDIEDDDEETDGEDGDDDEEEVWQVRLT